jgi:hypothetical protein
MGDIILAEVLQGFVTDRDFNAALRLLGSLDQIEIGGRDIAIQAARNFRTLRGKGITVRKDDRHPDCDPLHRGRRAAALQRSRLRSLCRLPWSRVRYG